MEIATLAELRDVVAASLDWLEKEKIEIDRRTAYTSLIHRDKTLNRADFADRGEYQTVEFRLHLSVIHIAHLWAGIQAVERERKRQQFLSRPKKVKAEKAKGGRPDKATAARRTTPQH